MEPNLVIAWRKSCRVNKYLIEHIEDNCFKDKYSTQARTVAKQFAHIHDVRINILQKTSEDFFTKVRSFPKHARPNKTVLKIALKRSEDSIASLLIENENVENIKNWNGPPESLLAYLIAHEGHHRGLIVVALRISGCKLPKNIILGMWDWGQDSSIVGG